MSVEVTPPGSRGRRMPPPGALRALYALLGDAVFGLFGSRMRVQQRPVVRLETVGARSGSRRRAILCWFPDREGSWLIVASLAGAAQHPAWFHNLARNPDKVWIEFPGGDRVKVRPESLRGAEREDAWQRIVSLAPGYAKYQAQTDRVIPVVRLVRIAQPESTASLA